MMAKDVELNGVERVVGGGGINDRRSGGAVDVAHEDLAAITQGRIGIDENEVDPSRPIDLHVFGKIGLQIGGGSVVDQGRLPTGRVASAQRVDIDVFNT